MAARGDSEETQDGETYIEKYTRGVLEVENILSLEKLRQVPCSAFSLGAARAPLKHLPHPTDGRGHVTNAAGESAATSS